MLFEVVNGLAKHIEAVHASSWSIGANAKECANVTKTSGSQ